MDDIIPQKSNIKYDTHSLKSSDIYGAESQWSAKLSQGAYNVNNFPNEAVKSTKSEENVEITNHTTTSEPEVTTKQPEDSVAESSQTQIVENIQKPELTAEELMMELMDFGKKMNSNNEINTMKPNINTPTEKSISSSTERTMENVDNRIQIRTGKKKVIKVYKKFCF